MSHKEHEKVIEETVDVVNGKIPVLAGTGSNNTEEAVLLTKAAKNIGADGVLVISPYYNKPNRSGLVKHYTKIANLDIPVVMYNVPGRTGQDLNDLKPSPPGCRAGQASQYRRDQGGKREARQDVADHRGDERRVLQPHLRG